MSDIGFVLKKQVMLGAVGISLNSVSALSSQVMLEVVGISLNSVNALSY